MRSALPIVPGSGLTPPTYRQRFRSALNVLFFFSEKKKRTKRRKTSQSVVSNAHRSPAHPSVPSALVAYRHPGYPTGLATFGPSMALTRGPPALLRFPDRRVRAAATSRRASMPFSSEDLPRASMPACTSPSRARLRRKANRPPDAITLRRPPRPSRPPGHPALPRAPPPRGPSLAPAGSLPTALRLSPPERRTHPPTLARSVNLHGASPWHRHPPACTNVLLDASTSPPDNRRQCPRLQTPMP